MSRGFVSNSWAFLLGLTDSFVKLRVRLAESISRCDETPHRARSIQNPKRRRKSTKDGERRKKTPKDEIL